MVTLKLPTTKPTTPIFDTTKVPIPASATTPQEEIVYRELTEHECAQAAATNAPDANMLDAENSVPLSQTGAEDTANLDQFRQTVRHYAALELRNQAAAAALERFFQLADAEARLAVSHEAFPILEQLHERAKSAEDAGVRFPLKPDEIARQLTALRTQSEQAEHAIQLLNLDLKRRLGLPSLPHTERLWPGGPFGIDPTPVNAEEAVTAALANRPELCGLRAMHAGLNLDTLPDVRAYLRAGNPLLGNAGASLPMRVLLAFHKPEPDPDPAAVAELEVRRKQLFDLIVVRERVVADEVRAAAMQLNTQTRRVGFARENLRSWEAKLADAEKQKAANQPGAELLESQVRTDWLRARAEVLAEAAAWHQARVRFEAAQGRYVITNAN